MQHRNSFITPEQARAKIIGQLHRIQQVTDNEQYMAEATMEFNLIASNLQYKKSEFLSAIHHMITKTKDTKWVYVYNYMKQYIDLDWTTRVELLSV